MAKRIFKKWCPCANDGEGGWGYFDKDDNPVEPPKRKSKRGKP